MAGRLQTSAEGAAESSEDILNEVSNLLLNRSLRRKMLRAGETPALLTAKRSQ